jgi:LmbE family N-acetylglucosaminyl deacetylase
MCLLKCQAVENMGLLRHDEAVTGEGLLGVSSAALTFLGYPDYGTLKIWNGHWGSSPPYRSLLTRVSKVPYTNARRPGTPYKGEEILRDLTEILRAFRPTKIFVSHPGDQHPDHRGLALFLNVALWDAAPTPPPQVYPYLVHLHGWPLTSEDPAKIILTPPAPFRPLANWTSYPLSETQRTLKRRALMAHRTQIQYDTQYLESFLRPNELFGDFPELTLSSDGDSTPSPAEQEHASLVGVETKTVRLRNHALEITVGFQHPLGEETGIQIFACGYRSGVPFQEMPKLRVDFGPVRHRVFDQHRELPWSILQVRREPRRLTLSIPEDLLGRPEKILLSARSQFVSFPLDWSTWHVLELKSDRTFLLPNRKKGDGSTVPDMGKPPIHKEKK